jgi:hypothetical protein
MTCEGGIMPTKKAQTYTPADYRAYAARTGTTRKKCPKCQATKRITDFGLREQDGLTHLQSYCTPCRAEAVVAKPKPRVKPQSYQAILDHAQLEAFSAVARIMEEARKKIEQLESTAA